MNIFKRCNQVARDLLQSQNFLLYLIALIPVHFFCDSLYGLVQKILGDSPSAYWSILLGSVLVFVFVVAWFLLSRPDLPVIGEGLGNKKKPKPHRGLIFLVSRAEACRTATEFHREKLEQVWLIHSNRPDSKRAAEEIQKELKAIASIKTVTLIPISDPYDPKLYYMEVRKIYGALPAGLSSSDVISDYAGMTAHGSVGMALACMTYGWPLEYTPAKVDNEGKPIGSLDPIKVTLRHRKLSPPSDSADQNLSSANQDSSTD